MKTAIDIDDRLMRRAMRLSGCRSKKSTVEAALRLLIDLKGQTGIRGVRGKIHWEGDLKKSRRGRIAPDLTPRPRNIPAAHPHAADS